MSRYVVQPNHSVAGAIGVPGDKSISHRSLMLGSIADGVSDVTGFLESEDCLATMQALRLMGVEIERPAPRAVRVHGVGMRGLKAPTQRLDMGNSGTAMRLMTGLLAGQHFDSELVGDASLMKRPMERVASPLRSMGANITTHNGCAPVQIRGQQTLRALRYQMPMASAQVKSAVMLAGLYADDATIVTEPAVTRDHTERMLQAFGAEVTAVRGTITLRPPRKLTACSLEVPGDFSSAAFFLVAGCLAARDTFVLRNVGVNPTRTGLLDILALMGADIRLVNHRSAGAEPVADIEVRRSDLRGVQVPRELVPLAIDEFPVLFIAAACAKGETTVTGAEELRVKESDRIAVMAKGLSAMGIECEVLPDGMRVMGKPFGPVFNGGHIDSDGDHRIAMSFSIASLRARAPIEISAVENVATSFPGFVDIAAASGIAITQLS